MWKKMLGIIKQGGKETVLILRVNSVNKTQMGKKINYD